jgi:cytochrome oxidase Cu insertion factor (SCO1/SenC/PrrC family)/thiol-disulfide isomerase/thioredoxin
MVAPPEQRKRGGFAARLAIVMGPVSDQARPDTGSQVPRPPARGGLLRAAALSAALAALVIAALLAVILHGPTGAARGDLANNPYLDPGTTLSGQPAPNFTLRDQFGQPTSLSQYRGRVVILAFNDSQCTTICPLTTTAMLDAKRRLGAAGKRVALLAVNANPDATSVGDVLAYSQVHGMTSRWRFLTGSRRQLERVWKEYGIEDQVVHGLIDHTPAVYVIDTRGRMRTLFMTQQSYSSVAQLGQLLAIAVSRLLPGHPHVAARLSYATVRSIGPAQRISLPRSGGGRVRLGPGSPHLYLFFDTWDREVTDLAAHLDALNAYRALAASRQLPPLTAVDEASVEPSPRALPRFLASLRSPLSYPVAIDSSGRVADGYEVQDEPWLVLVSRSGGFLYYRDVATAGWPSTRQLAALVRAALSRTPAGPSGLAAALRQLAGSPPALAALHRQSSRLIGDQVALAARIRSLRGYPIVVNVWGSWCEPCQKEFPLFADAAATYGTGVAFLGADYNDPAGDAEAFLRSHPVAYPSYQVSRDPLPGLWPGGILGTPTTIYINRAGRVVHVQDGSYASQGALDADIKAYALG